MQPTPEPFNVFSHRIDPRGVLELCRGMADDVRVVGPDDDWREIKLFRPKQRLRKRLLLTISHDSEFYERLDWSNYIFGLVNYIAGFAEVPRKTEIFRAVKSFFFVLGFPGADFGVSDNDERVEWLHSICRLLDGVIFTPSMLLDANGRLLIASDGRFDPAATLPKSAISPDTSAEVAFIPGDVEDEPQPPSARRVAQRAIALAAVANRGLLENEGNSLQPPEEIRAATLQWVEECCAGDELEPEEWKVLQRPCGTLDQRSMINAIWRIEGLGVLLRSLGLYEMPSYDDLVDPAELFDGAGIFDVEAGRELIATARLRATEDLAAYQNHATMAHWRFRNFSLRPEPVDFVAMSTNCWIGSFDIARFRTINNDIAVAGYEISKADPDLISRSQSTAMERHLAINWLLGGAKNYSDTDTST